MTSARGWPFFTGYGTAFKDQYGHLYFWVPIVGPLIGGLIGGGLSTRYLIGRFLPNRGTGPGAGRQDHPMADFVGAVDQGTTSTRFMIFDHGGNEVGRHQLEHEQILPQAGLGRAQPGRDLGAHQLGDPDRDERQGLAASDLAALGITNQRETTVVWNRKTGRPVLQRDRLAGHPHRPDRQRAGARRARAT